MNKIIIFITIIIALISINTNASLGPIPIYNEIKLSSNDLNTTDINAVHTSEVYTSDDIKKSNASNVYDFLTHNTSILVTHSFGNYFFQTIDARGFGLANANDSMVITLNGKRLNNIDSLKQFLANININDIEKIEITKGSGSVVYGDGAIAGSIHIFTKHRTDSSINVVAGNYGIKKINFNTGFTGDKFSIAVSVNKIKSDGYAQEDATGNSTKSSSSNNKITLKLIPTGETTISLSKNYDHINAYYSSALSLEQFNNDPSQIPTATTIYTNQKYNAHNVDLNIEHKINQNLTIKFDYLTSDKNNGVFSLYNYENKQQQITLNYNTKNLSISTAYSAFDGKRYASNTFSATSDNTTKDNNSIFVNSLYKIGDNSFSLGFRKEKINYEYTPDNSTFTTLSKNFKLNAYNIGFNIKLNYNLTLFSNYNLSFLSPNIDSFFTFNDDLTAQIFNDFIKPAKVKTLNIGINYLTNNSKIKLTLFRINLKNEAYFYQTSAFGGINTNIDKSHKYGLELQYKQQLIPKLSLNTNYSYIIAKIDEEAIVNGAYNGKNLPGVSKHNISLGLYYKINSKSNFVFNSKYHSSSHANGDFLNNANQRQKASKISNISYDNQYTKQLKFSANVGNVFKQKNGIWIADNIIYPTTFTRNININLYYKF